MGGARYAPALPSRTPGASEPPSGLHTALPGSGSPAVTSAYPEAQGGDVARVRW